MFSLIWLKWKNHGVRAAPVCFVYLWVLWMVLIQETHCLRLPFNLAFWRRTSSECKGLERTCNNVQEFGSLIIDHDHWSLYACKFSILVIMLVSHHYRRRMLIILQCIQDHVFTPDQGWITNFDIDRYRIHKIYIYIYVYDRISVYTIYDYGSTHVEIKTKNVVLKYSTGL